MSSATSSRVVRQYFEFYTVAFLIIFWIIGRGVGGMNCTIKLEFDTCDDAQLLELRRLCI